MKAKRGGGFLPAISLQELERHYADEKQAKAKIRLQCAILRKKGKTQRFIAEVTGKPQTTISGILNRFEKRGITAARAVKQAGQPKRLSLSQRARLKKILSQTPEKQGLPFVIWTTKLVQHIIEEKFGITYVFMQVHRLLKTMNMSLQKARPQHVKANKKLQREFKKNSNEELRFLGDVDMRSYFWTKAHSS